MKTHFKKRFHNRVSPALKIPLASTNHTVTIKLLYSGRFSLTAHPFENKNLQEIFSSPIILQSLVSPPTQSASLENLDIFNCQKIWRLL